MGLFGLFEYIASREEKELRELVGNYKFRQLRSFLWFSASLLAVSLWGKPLPFYSGYIVPIFGGIMCVLIAIKMLLRTLADAELQMRVKGAEAAA